MKNTEILPLLEKGQTVTIGLYFGSKVETINYRDKKTGQKASFTKRVHTVILGGTQPAIVGERIAEGVNADALKADYESGKLPFKPGSKVVVLVEGRNVSKGHIDMEASAVHALE